MLYRYHAWMAEASLVGPYRHALMVEVGAFSHKIDFVTIFKDILNLEGHPNRITGSKVTTILLNWMDFAFWWSFSGEGSASAACAAGLFLKVFTRAKLLARDAKKI